MTIRKEGTTPIALCILFIFVVNAAIQFYLPRAHSFKWIVYIVSFVLFVFMVLLFTTLRDGKPVIPASIRNIILPRSSAAEGENQI